MYSSGACKLRQFSQYEGKIFTSYCPNFVADSIKNWVYSVTAVLMSDAFGGIQEHPTSNIHGS